MDIKELTKNYKPKDVAIAILDIAHKDFNESNFNYYDYFFRVRYYVTVLQKDKIINKEQYNAIDNELRKLSLEMVLERDSVG